VTNRHLLLRLLVLGCLMTYLGFASAITNPSFESGNTTAVVSFNGLGYGGESAATGWNIWNNTAGLTSTELCTSATCPSGASSVPAPVDGTYDIHITSNGSANGIYQILPQSYATTAGVYLNIVTGSVQVDAIGPDGFFSETFTSSGLATLSFGSSRINEIVVYGLGNTVGISDFYADATTLTLDSSAPEPTTLLLSLGGLLTVIGAARRRRSQW
jgi:hypothetical protein